MADADTSLTFEQREGHRPLPRQLVLGELPPAIRAPLWAYVYDLTNESEEDYEVGGSWRDALRAYWVLHLHKPTDEFPAGTADAIEWLKGLVLKAHYAETLGFFEFVLRRPERPWNLAQFVDHVLVEGKAAYRVADNHTVIPISSQEEGETVLRAFSDVRPSRFAGARAHLHRAAEGLTAGMWADAVRESIHAVEAVARVLEPKASTLDPALAALERQGRLHPALKRGFSSLYGYTSDEKGIRHALHEAGDALVTETDALYMFGACAAFVSYLIRRSGG